MAPLLRALLKSQSLVFAVCERQSNTQKSQQEPGDGCVFFHPHIQRAPQPKTLPIPLNKEADRQTEFRPAYVEVSRFIRHHHKPDVGNMEIYVQSLPQSTRVLFHFEHNRTTINKTKALLLLLSTDPSFHRLHKFSSVAK